jgi:hypothetical protein
VMMPGCRSWAIGHKKPGSQRHIPFDRELDVRSHHYCSFPRCTTSTVCALRPRRGSRNDTGTGRDRLRLG